MSLFGKKQATASQMIHATIDSVTAEFNCGGLGVFRATGSTVKIQDL